MGAVVPSMWEELSEAIDETWGTDTETWKEIHVFDNLMTIIPRTVNHILVGSPLCRNKVYLANMAKFATAVVTASSLYLRFTPKWLKPLVGPLATIPNNRHYRTTAELTLPIIEERLANHKRKKEDPSFEWEEPNDFISWHIALAMAEDRQDELTPDRISRRLMPINSAAIHTTAMTTTHLLFDLISSDPLNHYLDGIRDEAQRILAEEGGHWTKAGLGRCHRADSAIRESMRVSNFMTRGVVRKVCQQRASRIKSKAGALQGVRISVLMSIAFSMTQMSTRGQKCMMHSGSQDQKRRAMKLAKMAIATMPPTFRD